MHASQLLAGHACARSGRRRPQRRAAHRAPAEALREATVRLGRVVIEGRLVIEGRPALRHGEHRVSRFNQFLY